MKQSNFQFSNPRLTELQFYINETAVVDDNDISINVELEVSNKKINDSEAIVELSIKIGKKAENVPFYIKAKEGARFRWDKDSYRKPEQIERLLTINAPALLLSYLRPIVAGITNESAFPAYNIPFINFAENKD